MKSKKSIFLTFFWLMNMGAGMACMILAGFYLYLSPNLPSVESIKDFRLQTPLRIYTLDHKLIGEIGEKRRKPIKFEDIPQNFHNALIAAEDSDFYSHHGVSLKGIVRAASQLLLTGRKSSGGSTLTMQLTRHIFLSLNRTFSRKFNEILLAMRIEKELSKQEIMELYVNLMFLGKRAYGIEAASEVYYGKSIKELNLAQNAMLVGVFKGPSTQNPISNPKKALERRNYVLSRMLSLKYINKDEYDDAVSQPVTASYHGGSTIELYAPYVAEMARQFAVDRYGPDAYTEGYNITTTIDSRLQDTAQTSIVHGLLAYDSRHGYRGAESTLPLPSSSENLSDGTFDFTPWIKKLRNTPIYGGLIPVGVVNISDDSIKVINGAGEHIEISFDHGLSDAKVYINENAVKAKPKSPSEVVKLGDLVRIVQKDGEWYFSQIPDAQAALVSLSPDTGAIKALAGGFDFRYSKFNRAIQAKRQPGSNFKPFIYTAALENGLTAATIINDAPVVYEDKELNEAWRPENSSDKFYGPTRLREALYRSINLVSIRVLERIGITRAQETLAKFGFDPEKMQRDLSLALGTHAVTPLQIATGYAVFANGGYKVDPYVVQSIEDVNGEKVYEALPATVCRDCNNTPLAKVEATEEQITESIEYTSEMSEDFLSENTNGAYEEPFNAEYLFNGDGFTVSAETKQRLGILKPEDYPKAPKVISEDVAYIIDSMMKDVIKRGTGYKAGQEMNRSDIAGKTGTTNGPMDAWFSGYQSDLVTSVWLGFDQTKPLGRREYGGSAALPIWVEFMKEALKDTPIKNRIQPPNIVSVRINPETGKRARVGDPDAIFEIFRTENVPELGSPQEDSWKREENVTEDLF